MTNRFATFTSRMAVALTVLFAVAACGGGGGGGGGGFLGEGDGGSTDTYFLQTSLKDADGNETSIVSTTSPGTLQVLVTRNTSNGSPVADVIVKASTDSGLLFPSSGSKLTNAEGLVTFRVEAGEGKGAGTIVVSVTDETGAIIVETVNFQLGHTGLRLGYLDNGSFYNAEIGIAPDGTISSEGEAILSLAIVEENDLPVQSAESIRITSPCLTSGESTISPENPIATVTGQLSVTYRPNGCVGNDSLTAELIGEGAQAFGDIEIAAPSANGLTFVSAEPQYIVLRGTGGGPDRVEKSLVTFQTVNGNGQPLEGVTVNFSLTTTIGELSLTPVTAISDAEGNVSTVVSSGDVATVVRVLASAEQGDGSGAVSAVSDILTVSTGLPDQNSVSLGVTESYSVDDDAFGVNGIRRTIVVHMADKFNNPVPDGTAAIFTTEYGIIDPSCETGRRNGERLGGTPQSGECSVLWTSGEPREPTLTGTTYIRTTHDSDYDCPAHNGFSGPCPVWMAHGGLQGYRSTILVTAIGEESFVDRNGNGIFDRAEADSNLFANLTEIFIDHNDNGVLDPYTTSCINNPNQLSCLTGQEETFSDFNDNRTFDTNGPSGIYQENPNAYPDAVYNGLLCPKEGDLQIVDGIAMNPDGWCSRELVNVANVTALMLPDDDTWEIVLYEGRTPASSTSYSGGPYTVYIADLYNTPPPAGASVEITATGSCEIAEGSTGLTVPNYFYSRAHAATFIQGGEGDESGYVTVKLTGAGEEKSATWPCTPAPPPPPEAPNGAGGLSLGG